MLRSLPDPASAGERRCRLPFSPLRCTTGVAAPPTHVHGCLRSQRRCAECRGHPCYTARRGRWCRFPISGRDARQAFPGAHREGFKSNVSFRLSRHELLAACAEPEECCQPLRIVVEETVTCNTLDQERLILAVAGST